MRPSPTPSLASALSTRDAAIRSANDAIAAANAEFDTFAWTLYEAIPRELSDWRNVMFPGPKQADIDAAMRDPSEFEPGTFPANSEELFREGDLSTVIRQVLAQQLGRWLEMVAVATADGSCCEYRFPVDPLTPQNGFYEAEQVERVFRGLAKAWKGHVKIDFLKRKGGKISVRFYAVGVKIKKRA